LTTATIREVSACIDKKNTTHTSMQQQAIQGCMRKLCASRTGRIGDGDSKDTRTKEPTQAGDRVLHLDNLWDGEQDDIGREAQQHPDGILADDLVARESLEQRQSSNRGDRRPFQDLMT